YPRSAAEVVPPATREIVVTEHGHSTTVTKRAQVARIIRWFDALPISPPGIAIACPLVIRPEITLSFRGAGGAPLAHATVPPPAPRGRAAPWARSGPRIGFRAGGKAPAPADQQPPGGDFRPASPRPDGRLGPSNECPAATGCDRFRQKVLPLPSPRLALRPCR